MNNIVVRIIVGLILAAIVFFVGTAITDAAVSGDGHGGIIDLIWALVAILIFCAVAFTDRIRL